MRKRLLTALCLSGLVPLGAGEVPIEVKTKVIRILATSVGPAGKVQCKDPVLQVELARLGLYQEGSAPFAYAGTEAEVRAFRSAGKLVICGRVDWLAAGAAIALVEEHDHPQIYFHLANLAAGPVVLSDAVLKLGKKI